MINSLNKETFDFFYISVFYYFQCCFVFTESKKSFFKCTFSFFYVVRNAVILVLYFRFLFNIKVMPVIVVMYCSENTPLVHINRRKTYVCFLVILNITEFSRVSAIMPNTGWILLLKCEHVILILVVNVSKTVFFTNEKHIYVAWFLILRTTKQNKQHK